MSKSTRQYEKIYNQISLGATEGVEAVYRSDWGGVVPTLIGLIGDFDFAEESAQEAFAAAVDRWRVSSVPTQ